MAPLVAVQFVKGVPFVILADEVFSANLVVISLGAFDVILGMDWLSL
jgi:hypothetical protein